MKNEDEKLEAELWEMASKADGEEKVDALIQLSYRSFNRGDHAESLALCETARDLYEALGAKANTSTLAHIYTGIGYSLNRLRRHTDAAAALDRAVVLYREIGSTEAIVQLRCEGDSWYDAKEYEKAHDAYVAAINEANPDVADREVAINYANAGSALIKLKRWSEALTNFLAARAIYKTLKMPGEIVHCDEEIALCYFWLGNGMEALHHAQLAMDFADTAEDDFHKMWALARMALAKKVLEEYDEALDLFADAKSRMVRMENPNWRAIIKLERQVASILVIKGRVSEAQEIERRIASLDYNNFMNRYFKPAVSKAGLTSIGFHSLRHTSASLLISQGTPVTTVSKILGHASTQMTLDVYGHLYEDDATTYMDRLGDSLFNAGTDKERTNVLQVGLKATK